MEEEEETEQQQLIPGLPDDIAVDCLTRVPLRRHAALRSVCHQWRRLLSAAQFRRHRVRIAASEDLFFLVQADTYAQIPAQNKPKEEAEEEERPSSSLLPARPPAYSLTVYNATLKEWRRASGDLATVPMFAQCAAVDGRVVLAGGWDPSTFEPVRGVHLLDPSAGTWRRGKDAPVARSFSAAATVGGRIILAGGHDGQKNALRTAEAYDPDLDEWESLPAMAEERDECRGFAFADGKFFAVSGYSTENQGNFTSSAEFFDPVRNQWSKEENMWGEEEQIGSGGAAACFTAGGRIYYIDCCEGGRRGVREWEKGGWRSVAAVPERMKPGARAVAVIEGKVFVMSVENNSGGGGGHSAWIFDVKYKRWSEVHTPPAFSGFVYSAAAVRL